MIVISGLRTVPIVKLMWNHLTTETLCLGNLTGTCPNSNTNTSNTNTYVGVRKDFTNFLVFKWIFKTKKCLPKFFLSYFILIVMWHTSVFTYIHTLIMLHIIIHRKYQDLMVPDMYMQFLRALMFDTICKGQ